MAKYRKKPDIFEETYEEVGDFSMPEPNDDFITALTQDDVDSLFGHKEVKCITEGEKEMTGRELIYKMLKQYSKEISISDGKKELDYWKKQFETYTKENEPLADRVSKIEEELFHRQDDEPAKLSEDKGIDKAFKEALGDNELLIEQNKKLRETKPPILKPSELDSLLRSSITPEEKEKVRKAVANVFSCCPKHYREGGKDEQ